MRDKKKWLLGCIIVDVLLLVIDTVRLIAYNRRSEYISID